MKRFISTAIDYVNGSPHVGHALEKIQADVYARALREKNEVYFLSGTDENSLKNVRAAEENKMAVKDFIDEKYLHFYNLKKAFNLSYNDFIRTTEKRHVLGAQKLWKLCEKDIYKKEYKGLYCVGCETFLKEEELVDGLCPIHKKAPEEIQEENYFFKLTNYQKQLEEIIEKDIVKIIPETRKNEILSFIKSGLEDFCISRDAKRARGWGIDVPGDETQKIWVWFDALSNYITALGFAEDGKDFEDFWQQAEERIHIVGKDILRFHAVYWLAMLLSAGLKLPTKIFSHGFMTVDGHKMSKSLGNVINPFELVEKYGVDPVRYFLLSEFPATNDGDFSYEKFERKYNAELSSGLGNLVARTLAMIEKKNLNGEELKYDDIFLKKVTAVSELVENATLRYDFDFALKSIWELIAFCDKYIEEKKPWEIEDREKLVLIFSNLIYTIDAIGSLLENYLPETSEKILSLVGRGEKINVGEKQVLFPRI